MIREEQRDIESTKYAEGVVEKTSNWAMYPLSKRMECKQFDGYNLAEAFMCGMEYADANPALVSVNEDLPKEDGVYLFRFDDGTYRVEGYFTELTLSKHVTHWMPLPVLTNE